MAFFGNSVSFSGLFGPTSQQQQFTTRIFGFNSSLLLASQNAKLAQVGLRSLSAEDRAAFSVDTSTKVTPPWQQTEESKTLTNRVREVRELTKFIDLKDDILDSVKGDVDKTATFALFRALDNLRVLAEYASENTTSSASLSRLNEKFQEGLDEIRDYISTTELDKLSLFLGDKEYKTEASVRTGKNQSEFSGSFVVDDPDAVISGLTGTEVFTVSIEKSGETDDIVVDLSTISGDLTLNNIKDHINTQIEALTALDDEGETYIKHQTRFDVTNNGSGQYGLQIDGTITEEVTLSAASAEPTLYVTSAVSQLDDDYAVTSRISEFNNLSGTITLDDTISFAAVDLEATDIKERTADLEDDDVDPEIAALRDKFRAEALEDVTSDDETSDEEVDTDNASSITNIDSDVKVNADTVASRVAVTSDGGIYVVGTSTGTFGHQVNTASEQDVFLTKFDNEGNLVFSRLLGVSESATAYGITVDSEDNVIVVGQTESALSTSDVVDSENGDAFVTKISKRGDEIFRYQLDTFSESGAYSVAVDSNNDIFVGGYTKSAISATSGHSGGRDALILKLDGSTGSLTDSNVFGTGSDDIIKGIAVDANDNLVVAVESADFAQVIRVDGTDLTNQTDTVDLGYLGNSGSIQGISIDNAGGAVYVSGITTNTSLDASGAATVVGTAEGGQEGFVTGLTLSGSTNLTANFTTYVSTAGTDSIKDVVVQDGTVYIAGSTTETLSGETAEGSTDGFVARVNGTTGALEDVQQFGEGLAKSQVGGVAFTTKGNSVLETLGLPTGTVQIDQTLDVQTQTSARVGDFFYISIDGGTKQKITLQDGDTFTDIARKLKISGVGKIDVEVTNTDEGAKLKISTVEKNGVEIDFLPGTGGRDLLERIGLNAGKLLPRDEVLGISGDDESDEEDSLGGVYGLKLDGALHIKDKTTAKYVLGLLDSSISTIQRAFRSLEYNPFRDLLNNNRNASGTVPAHLQKQLANFQSGLDRLSAVSASSSSVSLFV